MLFCFFPYPLYFIFIFKTHLCLLYYIFPQHLITNPPIKHSTLLTRRNKFLFNNVNCKWKLGRNLLCIVVFFLLIVTDIFYCYCLLFFNTVSFCTAQFCYKYDHCGVNKGFLHLLCVSQGTRQNFVVLA